MKCGHELTDLICSSCGFDLRKADVYLAVPLTKIETDAINEYLCRSQAPLRGKGRIRKCHPPRAFWFFSIAFLVTIMLLTGIGVSLYTGRLQYSISEAYFQGGTLLKQNDEKAMKWLSYSVNRNNSEAQYKLGCIFSQGSGTNLSSKLPDKYVNCALLSVESLPKAEY